MGGACCLHDTGVQKLTLNMLCPFLTSPGEGRPQHYITILTGSIKKWVMVCLQWQAMRQTQRPTETQISIHLHRIQFTVSVQYEHLHTILYNPFFIRLWIGLSVEQCEHTIKCRCFPGYLKLLFRIQLEAI